MAERCESLQMRIHIAELLRDHGQTPEGVRDLHFLGHTHAPMQLDGLLRDLPAGVGDLDLGGRNDACALERIGGGVDLLGGQIAHRTSLLGAHEHLDHSMLQRLE